jgi:hypothetical protein
MQPTELGVAAMRAVPTVFPDDGFKKLPTNRFIRKTFFLRWSMFIQPPLIMNLEETVSRPCDRSGLSYFGFVYRKFIISAFSPGIKRFDAGHRTERIVVSALFACSASVARSERGN